MYTDFEVSQSYHCELKDCFTLGRPLSYYCCKRGAISKNQDEMAVILRACSALLGGIKIIFIVEKFSLPLPTPAHIS